MRRTFPFVVVLVAAGCGGSQQHALGGGASLVPAGTVAFVAARTDADWRTLARLVLHRVPRTLPKDADEVDLAVLQGGKLLVLTHAHGTWSAASHPKPSLADAPNYQQSLDALPHDAVAQAYVRGDVTAQRLLAVPGETLTSTAVFGSSYRVIKHPLQVVSIALLKYRWGAAWLTSAGMGARARSAGLPLAKSHRVRTIQQLTPPYAPGLFDEIPADAVAVLDLRLPQGSFELLSRLPTSLTSLFHADPTELASALDAVLQGETAVYLRSGGEVTIVSSPADLNAAEDALLQLGPLRGLRLHRAEIGGQLVLSTTPAGIAAFRGGGKKLSADPDFRDAGFPDQVTALAYVTPAGARLLHTRPLTAYASPDGEDPTFTVRFVDPSR